MINYQDLKILVKILKLVEMNHKILMEEFLHYKFKFHKYRHINNKLKV